MSTLTVSKAIVLLAEEGYLVKSNRRGIFVQGAKPERQTANQIGILTPVMPDIMAADPNFKNTLAELQREIIRSNNRVSLHCSYWYPKRPHAREFIPAEEIGRRGLNALIIVGIFNYDYLASLARLRLPTAVLDLDATYLGVDSVCFDNRLAAFELTRVLIERGHTHILYVGGSQPPRVPHYRDNFDPAAIERADGYRLAMRAFAPQAPVRVFHTRASRQVEDFQTTAVAALQAAPECTAIVSEAADALVSVVDKSIELAGFMPKHYPPCAALTAVAECDFDLLAPTAVQALLKRFEQPHEPAQRYMFAPEIKVLAGARTALSKDKHGGIQP